MKLPDHTLVDPDVGAAIAERHGLRRLRPERLPDLGIINAIYRLGDRYALRVPRNHPAHIAQTLTEAIAASIAFFAEVRTPRLVAFDDTRDLLPVPYTIFEWMSGEHLSRSTSLATIPSLAAHSSTSSESGSLP